VKRFPALFLTMLLALPLAPTQSAIAKEGPVRSGTIVSGHSGLHHDVLLGCEAAPDCRAWVARDCDPALTGRDPAFVTSIEDVAGLATVSSLWRFEHAPGAAAYADVQFWRDDCTEIIGARWGSGQRGASYLAIPRSAKWMTVTGYTYNPWAVWLPIPDSSRPPILEWEAQQGLSSGPRATPDRKAGATA
jgi:hypothetical protein